jgi:hypothetical protein
MNDFPAGPFFNFRTSDEFPLIKQWIWIVFGKKKVATKEVEVEGVCVTYKVTAYYFRGVTFIYKCEEC